jgi:hypothetical protein
LGFDPTTNAPKPDRHAAIEFIAQGVTKLTTYRNHNSFPVWPRRCFADEKLPPNSVEAAVLAAW